MSGKVIGTVQAQTPLTVTVTPPAPARVTISSAPIAAPGPVGPMGPRGYTGPAGQSGADALVKLSLGPLSVGQLVRLVDDQHCQPISALSLGDAPWPCGVLKSSADAPEQEVNIATYGEVENDSWSFTPGGVLFLSATGFVTQTRDPAWAFLRVLGVALTPVRIFFDPQPPTVLLGG